ncbi:MAG: protoheme IX farnesyltransferase [Bacteroidia bacterium]|nr:protoheme IX farnesyltransferase [Bacteroidia bacterium]
MEINQSIRIRALAELAKLRISLAVAFSTFTGYFLFDHHIHPGIFFSCTGVFLLAAGSSALNQYQERNVDSKMERTKSRPLPSGRISPAFSLLFSAILLLAGSILMALANHPISLFLGWFSVIWYNLIYTGLKQRTPYALIIGALTGAIPPAIGWVCAGGSLTDHRILILSLFFYLWQVPHFCLLLIRYGREYEAAGFLPISKYVSDKQLKRITFAWLLATSMSAWLMTGHRIILSMAGRISVIMVTAIMLVIFYTILVYNRKEFNYKLAFPVINIYLLLIMIILIADHF